MKRSRDNHGKSPSSQSPGQVRIIAGSLRGSRLPVPDRPGLRPSPDRVRETLFNWLQTSLPGARALDLFAGVGALGFEAASRGAASVRMVERDPELAGRLIEQAARLKAEVVRVDCEEALAWLRRPRQERFDLVFLDPPFADGLWAAAIAALVPHLADPARVYVESPADRPPDVPGHWRLLREGRTRQVRYALYAVGESVGVTG